MAHAGPSQVPETIIAIQSPPLPAIVAPRSPSPLGSPSAPLLASRSPAQTQTSPSLAGSAASEVDASDELNTINIHIQINVPKSLALPCFRRSWYKQCGTERCVPERRRGHFLAAILGVFYISFLICGAVAWSLRNEYDLYSLGSHAPLVIATFSPLLDCFVMVSSILVIRRHSDGDKPSARYAVLFLMNFALFILHLVILIIAARWLTGWQNAWYYYNQVEKSKTVAGLILYSMSTMIFFKLVLALVIITKAGLRRILSSSVARIPLAVYEEYRYQTLTRDLDADARQIESARPSVESEQAGQIYLS
ncbi:hypothetical protein TWF696_008942 [Orbilia brochopaga]|uniref:Uncharacterized protein n=1 Tax=Orbilia brochopaga TaxID=3140254 RepID=A0AAV9UG31_9PEZI